MLERTLVLVLVVAGCVWGGPLFMQGRPHGKYSMSAPAHLTRALHARAAALNATIPPDQWFTQTLDHFNPQDSRTFQQRYQVNASFYQAGGPLFIMIGGEGPADATWIAIDTAIMLYAQLYKALVVQVEHRFYGETHPLPDLSDESLQYLSSEQALADLAVIRNYLIDSYNLPSDVKVITFGGSYSGALSAFFRTKYPQLAIAAVATSAPVEAELDFYQYQEVVMASLGTATQGTVCVENIQLATTLITSMLSSADGRQELIAAFKICPDSDLTNPLDVQNFMSSLAGNFDGIVQYNNDNRAFEGGPVPPNINDLCNTMVAGSNVLTQYAAINTMILDMYGESCLDVSYSAMIDMMTNTTWGSEADGSRQWVYQTCVEFGYYQTSDSTDQPFGSDFGLPFSLQQCVDIYNIAGPNVNWTNTNYGGSNISGTNIVFPNGSIDPWHALGVLDSDTNTVIYIEGTAHCANMYPPSPNDLPQLTAAREEIAGLLGYWLNV
eukprot:m.432026 g.432026  ORF g.432026 m.432026 type:complete len:496 (-) comp56745_c1_seq1:122-1609(-)